MQINGARLDTKHESLLLDQASIIVVIVFLIANRQVNTSAIHVNNSKFKINVIALDTLSKHLIHKLLLELKYKPILWQPHVDIQYRMNIASEL